MWRESHKCDQAHDFFLATTPGLKRIEMKFINYESLIMFDSVKCRSGFLDSQFLFFFLPINLYLKNLGNAWREHFADFAVLCFVVLI